MIFGKVIENKFIPDNPELFKLEFSKRNNKIVQVEVQAIGEKLRLYRFLYGVIYKEFKEHCGYDYIDEVDRDLKEKFLQETVENKLTGEVKMQSMLKSKVSKERLIKYVSDCMQFGNTEYGMNILTPAEWVESLGNSAESEIETNKFINSNK
jgi:hypothetical protein